MRRARLGALAAVLITLLPAACSPSRMGISRMASALTDTARAYGSDSDPEFVRLAAPSTLKMVEMLLDQEPQQPGLLLTACSGFTQYAYAFLQVDAEVAPAAEAARVAELRSRARSMYLRAREYCWRALERTHPGARAAITADPQKGLAGMQAMDVPALYWLAASWGGELGLAGNPLLRLPDLLAIRLVLTRALALNEAWEGGAIHEAMIGLDGMSPLLGGSAVRARQHFDKAVALADGKSAFAYVTLAESVSVAAGDRAEFEKLLKTALAVDLEARPAIRLANLIAQRRARFLLARATTLFPARR
jgi:hypothetical protein